MFPSPVNDTPIFWLPFQRECRQGLVFDNMPDKMYFTSCALVFQGCFNLCFSYCENNWLLKIYLRDICIFSTLNCIFIFFVFFPPKDALTFCGVGWGPLLHLGDSLFVWDGGFKVFLFPCNFFYVYNLLWVLNFESPLERFSPTTHFIAERIETIGKDNL